MLKNGKVTIDIPGDLDKQFREAIFNRYGMKKGNLTIAIEEVIKDWIKKGDKKND